MSGWEVEISNREMTTVETRVAHLKERLDTLENLLGVHSTVAPVTGSVSGPSGRTHPELTPRKCLRHCAKPNHGLFESGEGPEGANHVKVQQHQGILADLR